MIDSYKKKSLEHELIPQNIIKNKVNFKKQTNVMYNFRK